MKTKSSLLHVLVSVIPVTCSSKNCAAGRTDWRAPSNTRDGHVFNWSLKHVGLPVPVTLCINSFCINNSLDYLPLPEYTGYQTILTKEQCNSQSIQDMPMLIDYSIVQLD